MKLVKLSIAGFGRLAHVDVEFAEGMTIVFGPNEAGKTTLAECIVRMLFGFPRRQFAEELKKYEPMTAGTQYAANLSYRLDDGRGFEISRDFGKNDVPTETVEAQTRRPVRELSGNRSASPGECVFGFSLDVYRAAAMVRAGDLDGESIDKAASSLADKLASAVGSGGDESAAGAIDRLQRYQQKIGTTGPNTPLGKATSEAERADEALRRYREDFAGFASFLQQRAALEDELRDLATRRSRCAAAHAAARLRSLRARITAAAECGSALVAAQERRASVVSALPAAVDRRRDVDAADQALQTAESIEKETASRVAARDEDRATRQRELDAGNAALIERRAAAKRLDDVIARHEAAAEGRPVISAEALADLEKASDDADAAESRQRTLETEAAIARQRSQQSPVPAIASFAIAAVFAAVWWFARAIPWAILGGAFAAAGIGLSVMMATGSAKRAAHIAQRQAEAEAAADVAEAAAKALAANCRRLGCTSVAAVRAARTAQVELDRVRSEKAAAIEAAELLAARRDTIEQRLGDLLAMQADAETARKVTVQRRDALSALLDELGIDPGPLDARLALFRESVQAGTEAATADADVEKARSALMRVLGDATVESLEEDAARYGADAADGGDPGEFADRAEADLDRELGLIDARMQQCSVTLEGYVQRTAEFERLHTVPVADLEERADAASRLRDHLEACKTAAKIACETIESVKDVVHSDFTPRLNEAIEHAAGRITAGRYVQAWVDPKDFTIRVRAPETGATVPGSALSTGTLEQLQFALRSAAAMALGSGERVPLLYDDALAHADDARLRAAVEYAATLARGGAQIVFFTQRRDVEEIARTWPEVGVVHLDGPGT